MEVSGYPWYPLDSRLGGPQSQSGRDGEQKNSLVFIITILIGFRLKTYIQNEPGAV
jgi:hypothetical protein